MVGETTRVILTLLLVLGAFAGVGALIFFAFMIPSGDKVKAQTEADAARLKARAECGE